jgi:molybdenum cofactor cytidylyltransferase
MNYTVVMVILIMDHAEKAEKIIGHTLHSSARKIIVVTGADAERVKLPKDEKNIQVVFNNEWKQENSSYIKCGINTAIESEPAADAVILLTTDQENIDTKLINELISTHKKRGKPIVTTLYPGKAQGLPALFHQSMFPELLQLTGDEGPQNIIRIHEGNVVTVPVSNK